MTGSEDTLIEAELVRRITDNYEDRLERFREYNLKLMCEVYDLKQIIKKKDMLIDKLQSVITVLNANKRKVGIVQ